MRILLGSLFLGIAACATYKAPAPAAPAVQAPPPAAAPAPPSAIVDHVWMKDAETEFARKVQRAMIEKLRTSVAGGLTIPEAAKRLGTADNVHIGDHEEYPLSVLPEAVRAMQPGELSTVIPGDGGLHLFKIHARKN